MNFEKFDGNLEKSSVENIETNASQLEKNIEVEKPDSILAKESAENFTKKLESNYSPEILKQINSKEELKIYEDANLHEENVNGKICLVRSDIDWNQKDPHDPYGRTNLELAKQGLAPIKDGRHLELHHIGQHSDSSLAELTIKEHRSSDT